VKTFKHRTLHFKSSSSIMSPSTIFWCWQKWHLCPKPQAEILQVWCCISCISQTMKETQRTMAPSPWLIATLGQSFNYV